MLVLTANIYSLVVFETKYNFVLRMAPTFTSVHYRKICPLYRIIIILHLFLFRQLYYEVICNILIQEQI